MVLFRLSNPMQRLHRVWSQKSVTRSPWQYLVPMAISVFLAETFIMVLFLVLPKLPDLIEPFIDATLLSLLITPALYLFVYRPLAEQLAERAIIEQELRRSEAQSKEYARQLEQTLQELQEMPQRIHTEKMSSLGQLVAGVAHEINNPVGFIHGNLAHLSGYVQTLLKLFDLYQHHYPDPNPEVAVFIEDNDIEFVSDDISKIIASMNIGSERIQEIVLTLRNFSRLDEAQMKTVDIHEGIDSTLLLLQHRFTESEFDIKIVKNYGDLPAVECLPGQLNQVFMNVLTNAIDALMERQKQSSALINACPHAIMIRTQAFHDWVKISIRDSGIGMSKETQSRLFDPFFTTKPIGLSTGLGLSISHEIVVEKHKGRFKCISELGQGMELSIEIPCSQASLSQG